MPLFMASAMPELTGGGGVSWWQTVGGLVAVFGLLILCLRLLGRFQRRQGSGRASVLTVWPLGPKREIQVLRLGDAVHYVYRHDGAMVVLDRDALADWQARAEEQRHAGNVQPERTGLRALTDLRHLKTRLAATVARPTPN